MKRSRRSTGESLQCERKGNSSSGRRSFPVNLKDVLDTAKMKFEAEQDENQEIISPLSVPEVNTNDELKRKASSAPASPGKSLTVNVNGGSSKRSRMLRSESTSPKLAKVRRSSLLMPAVKTDYSTNNTGTKLEMSESTNSDDQDAASKKAKKRDKGVSMSEVIRLHQVSETIMLLS